MLKPLLSLSMLCLITLASTATVAQGPGMFPVASPTDSAPPDSEATEPATADAQEIELRKRLGSPTATWQTFRNFASDSDLEKALVCFDLTPFNSDTINAKGSVWVFRLRGLLNRTGLRPEHGLDGDFGDHPNGVFVDSLSDYVPRRSWMTKAERADLAQIQLVQSADGLWRFSKETALVIDVLWENWQSKTVTGTESHSHGQPFVERLRGIFPSQFHVKRFALYDWQWISLGALLLLGFVADTVVRCCLHYCSAAWFRIVRTQDEYVAEQRLWKPVGLLAQALVWYGGMQLVDLPAGVLGILLAGLKFFTVVAAIWTLFRLTDVIAGRLCRHAENTASRFDDLLIPLFSKTIKLIAIAVGAVMTAEAFHLPLTGLIGGLGLGGAALAFASKDAISNLFGSFTVLIDRPFEIGDWIISKGVEGTVESVGFRSTRVRTVHNSLVTVPNSLFTTAIVDNMGRRPMRRLQTDLQIDYGTTPEQIEAFCEGVRELIRQNPSTDKEKYRVCLKELGEHALRVSVSCNLHVPTGDAEAIQRQALYLGIMRLADALDISFAFPTRTVHMLSAAAESANDRIVNYKDPQAVGRHEALRIARPATESEVRSTAEQRRAAS